MRGGGSPAIGAGGRVGELGGEHVQRPAEGVGQPGIGSQQVQDSTRLDGEAVGPVVGLERVVKAQQAGPGGFGNIPGAVGCHDLGLKQRGRELYTLDRAPEVQESPAFVAVHRGRSHAGKGVDVSDGLGIEALGRRRPDVLDRHALNAQIGSIQAGPHLGAETVTYVARVFASVRDSAPHRVRIGGFEREVVRQGVRVRQGEVVLREEFEATDGRLAVQASVDAQPAEVDLVDRAINQGLGLHAQETAEVLGALQVAAHPVETLGAAGQHAA